MTAQLSETPIEKFARGLPLSADEQAFLIANVPQIAELYKQWQLENDAFWDRICAFMAVIFAAESALEVSKERAQKARELSKQEWEALGRSLEEYQAAQAQTVVDVNAASVAVTTSDQTRLVELRQALTGLLAQPVEQMRDAETVDRHYQAVMNNVNQQVRVEMGDTIPLNQALPDGRTALVVPAILPPAPAPTQVMAHVLNHNSGLAKQLIDPVAVSPFSPVVSEPAAHQQHPSIRSGFIAAFAMRSLLNAAFHGAKHVGDANGLHVLPLSARMQTIAAFDQSLGRVTSQNASLHGHMHGIVAQAFELITQDLGLKPANIAAVSVHAELITSKTSQPSQPPALFAKRDSISSREFKQTPLHTAPKAGKRRHDD